MNGHSELRYHSKQPLKPHTGDANHVELRSDFPGVVTGTGNEADLISFNTESNHAQHYALDLALLSSCATALPEALSGVPLASATSR